MKFIKENLRYVIIVLLIVVFTISIVPKTFQNDTFYTIAIGKQIVEHGLDDVERFAWHDGLQYQTPHWAFDYLNGLIYNVFELEGLYIFVCAISVIFMLVIYFNMVNKGINWVVAYISTMVTAYLLRESVFTDRAQLISYLLFFLEFMLIESFLRKKNILKVIGLFGLAVIIANIHAGAWPMFFILFLPYIGEYIIELYSIKEVVIRNVKKQEKRLAKLEKQEGPNREVEKIKLEIEKNKKFINAYKERETRKIISHKNENVKWLILIMIICVFAALLTPRPNVPYTYFLRISAGETTNYISEHLPTIIAGNLPLLIMTIVTIAMIGFTDTKIKLSNALFLLGLYFMAIISSRHVTFLVIFGSYIITKMIDDFLKKYGQEDVNEDVKRKVKNVFFVLLCIVITAFSVYFFVQEKDKKYIDNILYPVKATEWMKNNIDINNMRLYNEYNYGSYLLFKGIPVFVDSRSDLYTSQFNKGVHIFDDFINTAYGKRTIKDVFDEYKITHAIVPIESLENVYMNEDELFNELYKDDVFAIYQYNGNAE